MQTIVGGWAYLQHYNAAVYPDPWAFVPDRWLGEYDSQMDRSFVPFGRGTRTCPGKK